MPSRKKSSVRRQRRNSTTSRGDAELPWVIQKSSRNGSESSQDSSWSDLLGSMQGLSIHKATISRPSPSPAGSDRPSQILQDFFSDAGSNSSRDSTLSIKEQKLALWQAILVTVGLCEGVDGATAMPNVKRPNTFQLVVCLYLRASQHVRNSSENTCSSISRT